MSNAFEALNIRSATVADRPRLIPLINSAFSIESFIDGTRTNDKHLAAVMEKGTVLVAEDDFGSLLASALHRDVEEAVKESLSFYCADGCKYRAAKSRK